MLTYESSVSIARPAEAVFPYFVEPAKQALWSDVPMRRLTEGPFGPGSRMEVTFGMGPLKARVGLEITAIDQDRRMAWTPFSGSRERSPSPGCGASSSRSSAPRSGAARRKSSRS